MVPTNVRNRRRVQLLLILAVFAVPALLALALGAMGWRPGTDGHGEPILPQRSLAGVPVELASGGAWPWVDPDEPRMTLVALPGPDCAERCVEALLLARNARTSLGNKMERLRLLYVGPAPQGVVLARFSADWQLGTDPTGGLEGLRAQAPDSLAVVLVESNGTALSRYPAGFDPNGLRKDLDQVVKR